MRPVTLQTGYSRPDFDALLASREYSYAEAYTLRLADGTTVIGWTDGQQSFTVPPCDGSLALQTYVANDVLIKGLKFKVSNGTDSSGGDPQTSISVDEQSVTITPDVNDAAPTMINGTPFMLSVHQGLLRGATIQRDRWYFIGPGSVQPVGGMPMFYGYLSSIGQLSETQVPFKVKSDMVLLNQQMPRNLFGSDCQYTVYDDQCGVDRSLHAVHASVGASPTASFIPWTGATSQFTDGQITFENGQNVNFTSAIRHADATGLWLAYPLPYVPLAGDLFVAWPGCDLQYAGGCAYFGNQARWRATPNVPPANYAV